KNYLSTISAMILIGCNTKSNEIEYGTFELYENDSIVGTIYRIHNYQIEKYLDKTELIARIQYQSDSTYLINGIEETQIGVDSISWLTTYRKIEENRYRINAIPSNVSIDYQYDAILLKINKTVPENYKSLLDSLNLE
ncbi:MAG: hypothetical protein AAGL29_13345, partial [Bacteroidota bacterium]